MLLRDQVGTAHSYFNGTEESADYKPAIHGLEAEHHGGGCCGVTHLYGFPDCSEQFKITEAEKKAWLRDAINSCIDMFGDFEYSGMDYYEWRGCIEVVLSEHQLKDWCKPLEEAGFKQVFSFLNHNSGNECHVFLLETNRPA